MGELIYCEEYIGLKKLIISDTQKELLIKKKL